MSDDYDSISGQDAGALYNPPRLAIPARALWQLCTCPRRTISKIHSHSFHAFRKYMFNEHNETKQSIR